MAWELKINGNTISVETGDSIRITEQRNITISEIPMTDEEWAMDMITTQKTIMLSGTVFDGENGKSLSEWINDFLALLPDSGFSSSNYLKIKDADGNTIVEYSPVVIENLDISFDSNNPTQMSYSIQIKAVSEIT